jgi:oligopeptide transport system ATP-binding protein
MRQRVMIAMALACEPDILIADEPTTALDVTIQAQILELMKGLQQRLGLAIILITHDLGVVAGMCDKVVVMYAGRIIERGRADDLFYDPRHQYTKGLLRSLPSIENEKGRLVPISGAPVDMLMLPAGCAFSPRCDQAMKICLREPPEELPIDENHLASCWLNVRDKLHGEGAI